MLAYGANQGDLKLVLSTLRMPDAGFPWPQFPLGPDGESHEGQFARFLAAELGARALVTTPGGRVGVLEIITGERLACHCAQVVAGVDDLTREAHDLLIGRPPLGTRAELEWRSSQAARAFKDRAARLDLSWLLEAIAREHREKAWSFDRTWSDADQRPVSLAGLVASQLRLLQLEDMTPQLSVIPERGVHMLGALGYLIAWLDSSGNHQAASRYRPAYDAATAALLLELRGVALDPVTRFSLRGHFLEVVADPSVAKPGWLPSPASAVCASSTARETAFENLVLALLAAAEQPDLDADFGGLTHTLRGLRLLEDALGGAQ